MSTAVDPSNLFNDSTRSDLLATTDGDTGHTWHLHKCVVFSASSKLRDICKPNPDGKGVDQIIMPGFNNSVLERILHSMYETDHTKLFANITDDTEIHEYLSTYRLAARYGLTEPMEIALEAMRSLLANEGDVARLSDQIEEIRNADECDIYVDHIRNGEDPQLRALAYTAEVDHMPEMFLDSSARSVVSDGAVQTYFGSVNINWARPYLAPFTCTTYTKDATEESPNVDTQSAIDFPALFNDPKYSDLVVVYDSDKWYCHKCIVFSLSAELLDLYKGDTAEDGRAEVRIREFTRSHDFWSRTASSASVEIMLKSFYGGDGAALSEMDVYDLVPVVLIAALFDRPVLKRAAKNSIRQLCKNVDGQEVSDILEELRFESSEPELLTLADKLERECMPQLLMHAYSRRDLSDSQVQSWFSSVDIEEKVESIEDSIVSDEDEPEDGMVEPSSVEETTFEVAAPEETATSRTLPPPSLPPLEVVLRRSTRRKAPRKEDEAQMREVYAGEMEPSGNQGKQRVVPQRPEGYDEDDEEPDQKPKRMKRELQDDEEEAVDNAKRSKRTHEGGVKEEEEETNVKPEPDDIDG